MSRGWRILLFALAVMVLGGVGWMVLQGRDPLFRGKRESEWIKGIGATPIAYGSTNWAEVQRWRDFGPEGLRVLERGLRRVPPGRMYREVYQRVEPYVPDFLMSSLPTPRPEYFGDHRWRALDLLGRMGRDAWPAWRDVARLLRADDDPQLQQSAMQFFTAPQDDSAFLNQKPARIKKRLLPLFLRALKQSPDYRVRTNAIFTLTFYSEQAALFTPALAQALHDPVPAVRIMAAGVLHRVNPGAAKTAGAVNVLLQLLSVYSEVSSLAASALTAFQDEAEMVVPELAKMLQDSSPWVRLQAAEVLRHLDPGAARKTSVLAMLIQLVYSPYDEIASKAAMLIREFPNGAETAMPELAKTLHDPDPNVRVRTVMGMQRVDPDGAKKAGAFNLLLELLRYPNDQIAGRAAFILREFPNGAETAVAALAQGLQDPEANVRLTSAKVLRRLNAGAAKKAGAINLVVQLLRHPNDLIAARAASALREFPDEAEVVVPVLLETLRGTNTVVGCSAMWALEGFPYQAGVIVPELRKAAARQDNLGDYAQETLKHFGVGTGVARRGGNPKGNRK